MSDALKNLNRAVQALRRLETAHDGKCAVCGAKTYRDACVILRPGYWISPASFHEKGCALNKVMCDMRQEVIPEEEEEQDRLASADPY